MAHLYHYHAEYRKTALIYSIDGIATLERRIQNMNDYHALKAVIVKDLAEMIPADKLIICSLTPLGEPDKEREGCE